MIGALRLLGTKQESIMSSLGKSSTQSLRLTTEKNFNKKQYDLQTVDTDKFTYKAYLIQTQGLNFRAPSKELNKLVRACGMKLYIV